MIKLEGVKRNVLSVGLVMLITPSSLHPNKVIIMAKGTNDIILRDRLQFDIDNTGNTSLVYGRVDCSDYVSIPENKGLAVKEIRFQLRSPTSSPVGSWPLNLINDNKSTGARAQVKVFASTTAYEQVQDVGIASPNVICVMERESVYVVPDATLPAADRKPSVLHEESWFGTPDLHPEGYDIVTDLLIGIALSGCDVQGLADSTAELDVMIICEPKKITSKDLTQMLSQAQDL